MGDRDGGLDAAGEPPTTSVHSFAQLLRRCTAVNSQCGVYIKRECVGMAQQVEQLRSWLQLHACGRCLGARGGKRCGRGRVGVITGMHVLCGAKGSELGMGDTLRRGSIGVRASPALRLTSKRPLPASGAPGPSSTSLLEVTVMEAAPSTTLRQRQCCWRAPLPRVEGAAAEAAAAASVPVFCCSGRCAGGVACTRV